MRSFFGVVLLIQCLFLNVIHAAEALNEVQVATPYLELRTGPNKVYPIFHIVERGAWVNVLKQRTGWFKVRAEKGKAGWVPRHQLEQTLTATGEIKQFTDVTKEDYSARRWEVGFLGGEFESADLFSAYINMALNKNVSLELSLAQATSRSANTYLASASVLSQPFPRWRVSPYLVLGGGAIKAKARTVLVQSEDETFNSAHAGVGLRAYISRRFLFRFEYKSYVLFTSDGDNKEVDEWKVGFAAFF